MSDAKQAVSILQEAIKGRQLAEANLTDALAKFTLAQIDAASDPAEVGKALSHFQQEIMSW